MQKASFQVIFLTIFIYLVGFGMIIPILPALATTYGASAFEVGLVMATYSFHQFLFAPFWGRLSDRRGRRPVLLTCLAAEVLIFIGLAFADSLWAIIVLRSLAGAFGGSISTASAYVADVTDVSDRSKGMGVIGAAFGLGFVFGPVIGGVLISVGDTFGSSPPFGLSFPALAVSLLCLATFIFAYYKLPEPEKKRKRASRVNLFQQMTKVPIATRLLSGHFVISFAMANMEPTLFLLVYDRFQWDGETASYAFGYVGIMIALTQGVLLRRLLPKLGEPKLMVFGLITLACGFTLISFSHQLPPMVLAVTLVSVGLGLANPSLTGSLSASVSPDIQGEVFGVTQSLSALGRILGPLCGGWLYGKISPEAPFFMAGAMAFCAFLLILANYSRLPVLSKRVR